ncbi:MAG: RNA-binding domain-containing protein [Pseudomonadota bacterium]
MQDLETLIDTPNESETVEYKGWLDLHSRGQNPDRAILAKALIALRNHGGGYVVIGFDDEANQPLAPLAKPEEYQDFDGDVVQGIIRRHASPAFHCDLMIEKGHPIIQVPAGVTEPVITVGGSPDNGATLASGKYYIRCPGPESREPRDGLEWKALIDRCVANNRDEIVNRIIPVLRQLEALKVIEVVETEGARERIENLLDD